MWLADGQSGRPEEDELGAQNNNKPSHAAEGGKSLSLFDVVALERSYESVFAGLASRLFFGRVLWIRSVPDIYLSRVTRAKKF